MASFLKTMEYHQFEKWGRQYGPVVHLTLGPQHLVLLNTPKAADDLLVKRSKTFSTRASPYVAFEVLSAGQRMGFMPYNKDYKVTQFDFLDDVSVEWYICRLPDVLYMMAFEGAYRKRIFVRYRS